ncbi:MAG: TrkH family potassium uptake protein [Holophagaceae bacterium]|nr:TrkH family potassium uptake protein [Holophagaceae bacterium]
MKRPIAGRRVYGRLILLIGLLIAVPVLVVPFYPDEAQYIHAFITPSLFSVALGATLSFSASKRQLLIAEWQSPLEGGIPVMFAWCFAFFVGAVPFLIGQQLNLFQALFESVSGWTTTGLTVVNVTEIPHIFLFQRSFMQYCGGLGFIIMVAMFVQSNQNMNLYSAEGHPDRIMPSLKSTTRTICLLYGCLLVAGTLIYWLFGMKFFDAICHTMSAVSTAGFTTQANSIGEYGSLPIEIFTILLMLIGATNFAVLLLLLTGKFRSIFRVTEVRFMIGMLLVFVPLIGFSLWKSLDMDFSESIIQSTFGVVSTFTTSGYSLMNFTLWPPFASGLLLLLMFFGGCAGSTAGGLKLFRIYLLFRIAKENVRNRLSPVHRVTAPSYIRAQGKTLIDDALIKDTLGFVVCYIGIYIVGTLLLSLSTEASLQDAMFEFASAFGTAGISCGLTSPDLSVGSLLVLMGGMILGRLEIFVVFVGAYSGIQMLGKAIKKLLQ